MAPERRPRFAFRLPADQLATLEMLAEFKDARDDGSDHSKSSEGRKAVAEYIENHSETVERAEAWAEARPDPEEVDP